MTPFFLDSCGQMILVAVQLIILFHPFSIFCLWSAKGARAHCWLHTWTCNVLWLDSCELSRMFQAFSNDVSMTRNPKACAIHLRNSLRSCGFLSAPIFSLALIWTRAESTLCATNWASPSISQDQVDLRCAGRCWAPSLRLQSFTKFVQACTCLI